ncbi:hypothetical protein R6Q57_018240 [Mikania cordata]
MTPQWWIARGAGNCLRWKYRWVNILRLELFMTPQWWIARGAGNCLRWKYRWVNILRLELIMTPQWWIARVTGGYSSPRPNPTSPAAPAPRKQIIEGETVHPKTKSDSRRRIKQHLPSIHEKERETVAVRHGLYKYIRHNKAGVLSEKVREFLIAVEEEGEMVVHGGQMKPPKVLADIVESVAAAVYVDCGFNLQMVWMIFRSLLEPLVMLNVVLAQPQPVTALFEACHKDGKQVDIRHQWKGDRSIASVFVDDTFIAFGSSVTKDNAKIHAAKAALSKITKPKSDDKNSHTNVDLNHLVQTEGAKQKVCQICNKKKWPKPTYRIEQELGPAHDKRYISTVQVELADAILLVKGNERSRVKDAKNSAAAMMLTALRESGYA